MVYCHFTFTCYCIHNLSFHIGCQKVFSNFTREIINNGINTSLPTTRRKRSRRRDSYYRLVSGNHSSIIAWRQLVQSSLNSECTFITSTIIIIVIKSNSPLLLRFFILSSCHSYGGMISFLSMATRWSNSCCWRSGLPS